MHLNFKGKLSAHQFIERQTTMVRIKIAGSDIDEEDYDNHLFYHHSPIKYTT